MAHMTYAVKMADGQTWTMYADMEQASASIGANFTGEDESDVTSPYQTADAGHSAVAAAQLLAEYYAEPGDSTEVVSVEACR